MTLLRLLLLLAFLATPVFADEPDVRPNVVVIMCDDMGYSDLGCFGSEIETPHLDRLASEGLRLTRFYNNAKCTESRASLLSGLYYQQTKNFKKQNFVTLPEAMSAAGYQTVMVGKWHLPGSPLDFGFDRYFGFLSGAINFWTGRDFATGENLMRDGREVYDVPDDFYSTDAFTDRAIKDLSEVAQKPEPFFLYLAHNAPHFPLHAPDEEIAKYRTRYNAGWDALRRERFARMQQLGLGAGERLSPRDPVVPAWDSLTKAEQEEWSELMAVYAAMVDRLDQNVGRLMAHLDAIGEAENTLVIFFSDNGGCPYDFNRTPDVRPGPKEGFRSYNSPWANASNTPFRLYKQWAHEGGISSPCVVHWPAGLKQPGRTHDAPCHLIDILPTCLDLADATLPKSSGKRTASPLGGVSLLPLIEQTGSLPHRKLFWEFRGHHAVLDTQTDLKLVAESGGDWELYGDRIETEPPTGIDAEATKTRMATEYEAWAERVGALSHARSVKKGPSTQKR